ncbi:MAG: outer membrane beta-barrel protein [Bacteroidota bacterium]|nr:outer membrane beta-barrel protein [Bacteroidota bacterium]
MGKKNLEQLFKESFQNFQQTPDEKVWSSIEASLDNKKQKKRVIPIWWGLGGIAAALAILLMIINPFENGPEQEQIISDTDTIEVPEGSSDSEKMNGETFSAPTNSQKVQEGIANTSKSDDLDDNSVRTNARKQNGNDNSPLVNKSLVASNNNDSAKEDEKNKGGNRTTNVISSDQNAESSNTALAENTVKTNKPKEDGVTGAEANETLIAQNKENSEEAVKQSIYDAIEEQNELKEAITENKNGKWSVGPSLAPVYFDAAGTGSPVGSDFTSNSKSGKLNLSYGLTVAYELGKKLKIRSGVHRVDYGYNTNDVVFSSTLRAASTDKIANIDYNTTSTSIVVQSKDNAKDSPSLASKEIALSEAPSLDGKMVQQLGYIEVPLELNYALVDRKFGVDLIGGVSSLFLVDNAVLLESNSLVTEMGEANNINSLNFSANLGMGLNYKFSPKIRINVEPVFKYQLNTFSNVSGNFQPYSIGVYSGFSFRF